MTYVSRTAVEDFKDDLSTFSTSMALRKVIQRSTVLLPQTTDNVILQVRHFSSSKQQNASSYKLVVVGGGAGGCSTAAKFCRDLGKGSVAVIEPLDVSFSCFFRNPKQFSLA